MLKNERHITGESISPVKLVLRGVLAFLALLSLRVRYEPGAGLETGNFLIDNLSKLANQFYYDGLSDIILFFAIFVLLNAAFQNRKPEVWTAMLALVFALLYNIGMVCRYLGNFAFFFANLYQFALSTLLILGHGVVFYAALSLIFRLMEAPANTGKALKLPWRSGALILFFCWLPWLLANYPGSFCSDSTNQLEQFFGAFPWSTHHPPLSSVFMGLCVSLGDAVLDRNFGAFLSLLFQSAIAATAFSYMLALLYRSGLSRRLWTVFVLFFATPFWGCFVQWFEKDLSYAIVFALLMTFLFTAVKEQRCSRSDALRIFAAALLALLLRKTALYELLPAMLIIGLWLKKAHRLRLCAATLAALLLCSCVNNVLYPALGFNIGSSAEALSIPFQQTARYVNEFPDEVTEAERAAIDAVLVYDELDQYKPEISDPIKINYRENGEAMPEYIRHWFSMLLKHPLCYFEAGFMLSYGYLAPVAPNLDAYISSVYTRGVTELGIYRVFDQFPTKLLDSIREMFIQFPLTNLLCTAGLYTWILMACFVQLLRKKKYSELLLFIPGIMNILICIASPLSCSTRYELPLIASIPLIVGVTLIKSKKQPQ